MNASTTSTGAPRTAYDDPASPAELAADCRAADASLDLHEVGRRLHQPAPSLRFEDFPQGLPEQDADMLAAAGRLARALHL